jgi:hypothetical protein
MEKWMAEYSKQLEACVRELPHLYVFGPEQVPTVLIKMREGFEKRTYNKDGEAVKRTCKALGIKHTYKAINSLLDNYA